MNLNKLSFLMVTLLLTSCNQVNGMKEISGAQINQHFGHNVYSLLPKIYSNDYDVTFTRSDDYPADVYVDLNDWTEKEATKYQDALDKKYEADVNNVYTIDDSLFILIYHNETASPAVFGLNVFADYDYIPGAPATKDEMNGDDLNAYFTGDLYSYLPAIHSENYELIDYSSNEYPLDLYLYLHDWRYPDAYQYDKDLSLTFTVDEEKGYIITDNLYIFVMLDMESYDESVVYINIYSLPV